MQICLTLPGPTLAENRRILDAQAGRFTLAELRADLLDPAEWPDLQNWARAWGGPLLLTLRQPADGGRFTGGPAERQAFFKAQASGPWAWWDLEADQPLPEALEDAFRRGGGQILRSMHAFGVYDPNWPRALDPWFRRGEAVKAAVSLNSSSDLIHFLQTCRSWPGAGPRVLLGMGAYGAVTRLLGARWHSAWTYAAAPGQAVAPGQISVEDLADLYRVPAQGPHHPAWAIVGHPVSHSRSPQIHNPGLQALGVSGLYVPLLLDRWSDFSLCADLLGLQGASVTIPFKEDAAAWVSRPSASVRATGACNTVWREGGAWAGDNTDAPGFLSPLAEAWGGPEALKGRRATVIGTGGSARALIWALVQAGVKVLVAGRNLAKTQALAAEFGADSACLEPASYERIRSFSDVLVQCTSLGMGAQSEANPLPDYPWTGRETAYDIVYAPAWTPFLKAARAAGCACLLGRQMLFAQARLQFRHFTGADYPLPDPLNSTD